MLLSTAPEVVRYYYITVYLCVGNLSLTEAMMSCSTFWSVLVTRSTEELLHMTFISFCSASLTIYTGNRTEWYRKLKGNTKKI